MPEVPMCAPQCCRFAGDGAPDAPRVWALPIDIGAPFSPPEAARQDARSAARAALRALLAEHFALPVHAITLSDQRGAGVRATLAAGTAPPPGWATLGLSISHEASVALVALRTAGPVGVDVAVLPAAWSAHANDVALRQQAALYLGPAHPAAQAGADAACFARGWAAWEARLKCLGEPLMEWSPALAARLGVCQVAALALPAEIAQRLPAPAAAAVAWRGSVA
ncbi:hypothetical protein FVQ98_12315 [Ottowia sp. GY511]|uniref:4'-phosphopantetheinyl transferase superfamily protein n=1 Tax=Ottowia flava TaxID=2675430 RepID=A0ABW4KVL3_9BURK|nr:hypothetical protein [Ottowia sp. GY511]TXK27049.1 hypothetical protein FVQ98_12315 [Ottowia sp. GY511]